MSYYNTCQQCGANLDPGERCDCEKDEYRVQEYMLDQGAFRKRSIFHISRTWYHNTNNDSLRRRLVILSPDDWYGNTLPEIVRTWDEMTELVCKAESAAKQRERNAS